MKTKLIFLALTLLFVRNLSGQTTDEEINAIVDSFRVEYKVPAIAAAVLMPDTIRYGLTGQKRIDQPDQISLPSRFHLASNTKAITATLAARLVEQGIIKWNEKLVDAIPELKTNVHAAYENITLEQLLSHRAMIAPFEEENSPEWKNIPESVLMADNPRLSFARYALGLEPVKAKEPFLYSNGGYILAALMLEFKSGKTWEMLVEELFTELKLDYFTGFPSQQNPNDTHGHHRKGKKYKPVSPDEEYPLDAYFSPAGNLSMSLVDFSKFIKIHLDGLMDKENILKPDTYQKLHYGYPGYALGWYNGNIGETNQKFSYHGGSLGSFSSAVIISADRAVAIVILINSDDKQTSKLKKELRINLWDKYGTRK